MAKGGTLSVGTKVWAEKINGALRKSAEGYIEAGKYLLQAKEACPRGDFTRLITKEIAVDERQAQRMMAIADDPRFSNPSNLTVLPKALSALYAMHKLDDKQFQRALDGGAKREKDIVKIAAPEPTVIDVEHEDISERAPRAVSVAVEPSLDHAAQDDGENLDSRRYLDAESPPAAPSLAGSVVPEPEDVAPAVAARNATDEPEDGNRAVTIEDDPQALIEKGLALLLIGFNGRDGKTAALKYDGALTMSEVDFVCNHVIDFTDEFTKIGTGAAA